MAKKNTKSQRVFVFGIFLFAALIFGFSPLMVNRASAASGNATGYAWSDQTGWIRFGCTNCDSNVTNSALTGWAWSPNYGWINLSPSNASCTVSVNCGVKNDGLGVLSGSAWGEKLGWIDFSTPGVTIDNSTGKFLGTATGSIVGTVTFGCTNCGVTTTWRPVSCGDGVCSGTETCDTCPQDCGACGGGGPILHNICDYIAQKCVATDTGGVSQCSDNSECICDPHGDFNHDGYVEMTDFSIMLHYWLLDPYVTAPPNPCVDLSKRDNAKIVNIYDFSVLLSNWKPKPRP